MSDRQFGQCCKDLRDAMQSPPNSFFRVEENGFLYLTVGYMTTEKGPAWFDQAVQFCPFCGTQLQSFDEIRARSRQPVS
ncbi:MAG TPA: hypothetical protein VKQ32_27525 [Polyangia bacterium]|nr:hypothetical protein [Polyangia bacterium]